MPKPAPKHSKPAKLRRKKMQFYVDPSTVKILDKLVRTMPELDNRSAALRYAMSWYDRAAEGKDATS